MVRAILVVCLAAILTGATIPTQGGPESTSEDLDDENGLQAQIQHLQQGLIHDLLSITGNEEVVPRDAAFEAARTAIDQRQKLMNLLDPYLLATAFDQQQRNLELAEQLLALDDEHPDNSLEQAIASAKLASRWQAASLDLEWQPPVPLAGHGTPSQAVKTLAQRHDLTLSPEDHEALDHLDALEDPLSHALVNVIDAFQALDTATQYAYEAFDGQRARELTESIETLAAESRKRFEADPEGYTPPAADEGPGVQSLPEVFQEIGLDLSLVLPTRAQFLDAVFDLYQVLQHAGPITYGMDSASHYDLCPVFAFDLQGADSLYESDCALIIDLGGNDVYHNNAGGSNLGGPCTVEDQAGTAAALVDLGPGDDRFGDDTSPLGCGINGGSYAGTGVLINEQGNNTYHAGDLGVNGGGAIGTGLLVDSGGSSVFDGGHDVANGGGGSGIGMLVSLSGDNQYTAGDLATNGGGYTGIGFLLSGPDDDLYEAGSNGANGGAVFFGQGFVVDLGGNDHYTARGYGGNGGGEGDGGGFLLSAGGDDLFVAGHAGSNGGASGVFLGGGSGVLVNLAGNDQYLENDSWAQMGINGGGLARSFGMLLDFGGDDFFQGRGSAINGGAWIFPSTGLLFSARGDDQYLAEAQKVGWPLEEPGALNGGGFVGNGLLLDARGTDYYEDPMILKGECWDCTIVPKEFSGAQVDIPWSS